MLFESSYTALDIPDRDVFTFLFERKDRKFPDNHPIFRDGNTGRTHSFHEVQQLAERFGSALRSRYNWSPDDVLTIASLSDIDMPPIVFGTLWAEGIVSTSNPAYTVTELTHQLRDSNAKCIVTHHSSTKTVSEACRLAGIPQDRILLLGDNKDTSGDFEHWTSLCGSGAVLPRTRTLSPREDTAFLVYSSGTTGKPKGVQLTHYNIVSNILQLQVAEGFNLSWNGSRTAQRIPLPASGTGGDKVLACLPFFHIYGLTVLVHSPVYSGVTTIVLPRFTVDLWCEMVQKHKITYSYIVPPIVLHLAKHPSVSRYDLSSLRMTQSGAAPLTRELIEQVFRRLSIRVKQGYGLSETSPCLFQSSWNEWNVDMGSCGLLLPNLQAKICQPFENDNGSPTLLAAGEVGELHVKGPNVFRGYHNNVNATKDCLSADGWFRTGDIGYMTPRGSLFITDRVKELIKYKGFQVAPAELEGCLLEYPGVADCAVVGVFDKSLATEVPRAYIVLEDRSKPLNIDKLQKWFGDRVAPYKRLRGGIQQVQKIPKNASGKILRKELRQVAREEFEHRAKL